MEALIESVRRYPSVWQVRSKAYKDLRVTENAWKVSEETGLPQEECKKKWKGLRDKFVRELKKVKHRVTGEEGPPYMPSREFFDVLLFLTESVKHRQ